MAREKHTKGSTRKKKLDPYPGIESDSDEHFAFISGYTSGGAPHGVNWEEMEELKRREEQKMDYDTDKVDEATLALMALVVCEREEGYGARAWKGFDWGTLDRLHEKGLISDPKSKVKSVVLTEEAYRKSNELFEKLFGR